MADYHPNRSPISISSSYSWGGGGAFSFFSYFLGAYLVAAGAVWAAWAGADDAADPPKLKNELISLPSRALANILAQ